jgi:hypothetical protein
MANNPARQLLKLHWLRSTRTLTRLHSPGGSLQFRTLRTLGRPSMKRPGDPPVTATIQPSGPPEATPRSAYPSACCEHEYDTMGRGISNVLSYRDATSLNLSHTGYSKTKVAGQDVY